MRAKNFKIRFLLLASLSLAASAAVAKDHLPPDPNIGMSQQKLLCRYILRNVQEFAEGVGTWFKYRLRGKRTPDEEMIRAFKRHPELYESMRVTEGRRFAGPGNQLMTFNTVEDMKPVAEKTLGFCYGHATVRTYMQRLSLFDPEGKFVDLPRSKRGSKPWVKFYFDRIMDMLTNEEPQIFPGFANLEELSSDPVLGDWIRYAETQIWAERAGHLKNVLYRTSTADMKTAFSYQLIHDLQHRLDAGMNPIIMFDENSNKLVKDWQDSLHVVTVVNLRKMENDRTAIIILDDKKPCGPTGRDCYDVLILHHHGKGGHAYAYFDSWRWKDVNDHSKGAWDTGMGTVNQIRIVSENDHQYMRMAMNWADFCRKNPEACTELGDRTVHPGPIAKLPKAEPPYHDFAYALDPNGQPAPIDPMDFDELAKTGTIDELLKARTQKKAR